MIKFGTYKDISSNFDEIWYIMRSVKNLSHDGNAVVRHVPLLSPSTELFQEYLYMRNSGQWNVATFHDNYVPKFLKEMQGPVLDLLNKLYKESKHKDFLLVCACQNEAMCHRSIIAGILQGMYSDIDIQSQDDSNYLNYYYEFMKHNLPVLQHLQTMLPTNNNTFCLIVGGYFPYNDNSDYLKLEQILDFVLSNRVRQGFNIKLVSGHTRILVSMIERYASSHNYYHKAIPVDWNKDGKRAWYVHAEKVKEFVSSFDKSNRGCVSFWNERHIRNVAYNLELAGDCKAPVKVFNFNDNAFLSPERTQILQDSASIFLHSVPMIFD